MNKCVETCNRSLLLSILLVFIINLLEIKIINCTKKKADIVLSLKELNILNSAIYEVKKLIYIYESYLKLEVFIRKIKLFLVLINKFFD